MDEPVSERPDIVPGAAPAVAARPVHMVMSGAFVSESGINLYESIAHHLARKTGITIEVTTGLAYSTINSMLETGAVELGFICGLPYTVLRDLPTPRAELLGGPIMKYPRYGGQPVYFADLVVRNDSPYHSLEDLRGRTLVYNDERSHTGYNAPRHHLMERGFARGFFGKVVRSGSHEESIRMVAAGEADASWVDSLVLDYDREKRRGRAGEVRVLESIGPMTVSPVVASPDLPAELRAALRKTLLGMHEDPDGKRLLDAAFIERFAPIEDAHYDAHRSMMRAAEKAEVVAIR
ncbi:phosphate/phosphite/phosphonate ABC transporter substrate-binding protein [Polyangium jinanense]|uniref:PhnD/SsuA/transferrin family substrate-binding protein n=1 Tax=Polyangium jinanense TaxID=2829994 RepID=A0A9X4AWJ2_9BACT|nr:PhnD/SsuA/transferrin family substrate-binding protein [Polyangium jinanense]MDC3960978.1 PhnD/SsuA/transferrin family substrate-binding protein [Polyangium jinanense]MDC3987398.1 PhnD/SsuA/transferrin family substrate-binding protein [Polyangium jinanense]